MLQKHCCEEGKTVDSYLSISNSSQVVVTGVNGMGVLWSCSPSSVCEEIGATLTEGIK